MIVMLTAWLKVCIKSFVYACVGGSVVDLQQEEEEEKAAARFSGWLK